LPGTVTDQVIRDWIGLMVRRLKSANEILK
jgi:hypothetical protein